MTGVRDYITGKIRFPGGPESSCGEDDVQMVENVDLLFGDNEELKFGDDGDVYIKWNASNLTILPLTDLTGAINIGNGTLSMDFKVFGTEEDNYFEYDASEDQFNIVVGSRTITGKDIALNISMVGTVGASDYIIGLKSDVTPDGGGAIYGMAVQGILNLADAAVSGYACAAEFRLVTAGAWSLCDNAVLVLATDVENSGSPPAAIPYIMLREYGTAQPANVLARFFDHTRASASDTVILSLTTDTGPFDTAIRCMVGTTPFWLYGSTTGPTTFEMAWAGAVRNKGLNFNDATFEAGSNYNLLSYGDYGNTVTLSITDHCFVMRMNVTSAADPGSDKLFTFLNLAFAQSTEAQAHLFIHGIALDFSLTKNVLWCHALNVLVDIEATLTAGAAVYAGKFSLNRTSATVLTCQDMAAILAEVSGNGTCAGMLSYECVINVKLLDAADVDCMLWLNLLAGTTATNAITIGNATTGLVTNFVNFVNDVGINGAWVGPATDNAASDGAIRILVAGTEYFIPFYTAAHTTNNW